MIGAGNETRTRDPDLGKVVLYQLSYSRNGISLTHIYWTLFGAGNETRTRDPDLGKVVLYQLSYSRNRMSSASDWSGKRDSNSRPRPWQGRALPTELFPHRNITYIFWSQQRESRSLPRPWQALNMLYQRGDSGTAYWSGKRDSNSRPRPWQGRALPTELFPQHGLS